MQNFAPDWEGLLRGLYPQCFFSSFAGANFYHPILDRYFALIKSMILRTDEEKYYRTTSLPLAIFLYAKDQQIAGVNYVSDSTKKEFAFVRSAYLDELAETYKFAKPDDENLLVSVRVYEQARNSLLDRLNDR